MRFTKLVMMMVGVISLAACNSQAPDTSFDQKSSSPSASGAPISDFPGSTGVTGGTGGMGGTAVVGGSGNKSDINYPAAMGCSSISASSATDEQFITLAYCQIFKRLPDTAGHDYWIAQLSSGYPRVRALVSFELSSEAQANYHFSSLSASDFVSALYPVYLNRGADPGGLNYWTNRLNQLNGDRVELTLEFLNTAEPKIYWNM